MLCFYPCDARMLAVVVCPSVCLSQVGLLLKQLNVGSRKQRHTTAQRLCFWMLKISASGVTPTEAPNAGAVAANWRLSTRSVVFLGWYSKFITLSVHLICLQHVCRDAARRAGFSATADPCMILKVKVKASHTRYRALGP